MLIIQQVLFKWHLFLFFVEICQRPYLRFRGMWEHFNYFTVHRKIRHYYCLGPVTSGCKKPVLNKVTPNSAR